MNSNVNRLGQPIGFAVAHWMPRCRPPRTAMEGRFCRVAPMNIGDSSTLRGQVGTDQRKQLSWPEATMKATVTAYYSAPARHSLWQPVHQKA